MQRTKSKILSILLSLVMLLSLVPAMGVTALAAAYPDSVRVYNGSGTITSLSDGQCLVTNDASATSYTGGTSYVARYEKSTGTLYLKDYHGVAADDQIYATGDLNIVVENDSSFSTSKASTYNLYGIQAEGKLNISGSGKLTVTANGRGDVYGIYAKEGVTISAPLDVRVGKNNVTENGSLYGIYTQSGAISLSGNDMTVTATGGTSNVYGVYNAADTSTTITNNGNIDISGKLTVNLGNGSNNRGISSQGGVITLDGATVKISGSYYYGIFNKNGNVVIKSCPDVELTPTTSSGEGICTYDGGDLTIENSTVKVSAQGYAASVGKGALSIKDSTVELTKASAHHLVVNTSDAVTNTIDLSGGGSVTITATGNQSGSSMIGGKVTATPGTKLEKGKHYPSLETYDGKYDAALGKTVLQFVHEDSAPTADISVSGTIKSYNPGNTTTIQLMQGSTEKYSTTIAAATGSGQVAQSFSFDAVAKGTYDLVVTKPGHLTYTVKGVVVGDGPLDLTKHSNAAISTITLLCGDIDGNGFINSTDLGIILKGQNYGKSTATAGDKAADLDGNGFINSTDLGIVLQGQHYGKSAVSVNFGE